MAPRPPSSARPTGGCASRPTGRRAGLITGPDVWQVAMWIDDLADTKDPAEALAKDGVVTRAQIDAAMRYAAAYPDEVRARIDLHRSHTSAITP